jgi:hypothetical protein
MHGVVEDVRKLGKLGIQRWWIVARDRQLWKRILQEAGAQCGLYATDGDSQRSTGFNGYVTVNTKTAVKY